MPSEMLPKQQLLMYQGILARPAFELWSSGAAILEGLHGALSPLGLALSDIRFEAGSPSPAEQSVSIYSAALGTHRFKLQGLESSFLNVSEEVLRKVPAILAASTGWLRRLLPGVEFLHHQFVYSCHSQLQGRRGDAFLRPLVAAAAKSGGLETGKGVIMHWAVPERHWETARRRPPRGG